MVDSLTWDAWSVTEEYGPVIYVVGEVTVSGYKKHLVKKHLSGLPASNLLLEVVDSFKPSASKIDEVIYSEKLCTPDKYKQVTIFLDNRVIAEIEI